MTWRSGLALLPLVIGGLVSPPPIDRRTVVGRHDVQLRHEQLDPVATRWDALTVGNGEFAFTADVTGLQSLNRTYRQPEAFPLYTMSNWGWHTPDPAAAGCPHRLFHGNGTLNYTYADVQIRSRDPRPGKGNRTVPYQFDCRAHNPPCACDFLYRFPARVNLGQLAFVLPVDARQPAGPFRPLELRRIRATQQRLDLYTGALHSAWSYVDERGDGAAGAATWQNVSVVTVADGQTDTVAARYTAPSALGLAVQLAFCAVSAAGDACDWRPFGTAGGPLMDHQTTVTAERPSRDGTRLRLDLRRRLHRDAYAVSCVFAIMGPDGRGAAAGAGTVRVTRTGPHAFAAALVGAPAASAATLDVSCRFASECCVGLRPPVAPGTMSGLLVPSFTQSRGNAARAWGAFWERGAFVDMLGGGTRDPRAAELERRTIQSLYLLRAQEAGSVPPQESGLLYNSWTGKHHSEMRYWHQMWMPVWTRPELLARSDQWFIDRLSNASAHAARQGYEGCRWGKMLGEANLWGVGRPNRTQAGVVGGGACGSATGARAGAAAAGVGVVGRSEVAEGYGAVWCGAMHGFLL